MVRVIQKKSNGARFNGFIWSPEFGATIISVLLLFAIPVTILLTNKQQDLRQHASSINRTATISVYPTSGSFKVDQEYGVSVVIDGGTQSIDSVKSHVGVSTNLTVTSLTIVPVSEGGCNLTYPNDSDMPSVEDPSFQGILPTNPIFHCTLYKMTLRPTSVGTGAVTLSNAEATSPDTNGDIIQNLQNATFTISN